MRHAITLIVAILTVPPVFLHAAEPVIVLRGIAESELGVHGQGNVDAPEIHRANGQWLMWSILLYESHEGTRWAASDDGLSWQASDFLAPKSQTEADRGGHVTPFLLTEVQGGGRRPRRGRGNR